MGKMTSGNGVAKSATRIPRAVWFFVVLIMAVAAAIGASLYLSRSLIRPLQKQQEQIRAATVEQQQLLTQLAQDLAAQQEQLRMLQEKIEFIVTASPRHVRELASIQKERAERERLYTQQLAELKLQLKQLENSHDLFGKNVDKAKSELERENKALRDDLQVLQSSLNDMKNKLEQLERQVGSR